MKNELYLTCIDHVLFIKGHLLPTLINTDAYALLVQSSFLGSLNPSKMDKYFTCHEEEGVKQVISFPASTPPHLN